MKKIVKKKAILGQVGYVSILGYNIHAIKDLFFKDKPQRLLPFNARSVLGCSPLTQEQKLGEKKTLLHE